MCDDKNGKSPKSDDENELSASDESEPEEAPNNAPFDPELDGEDDDDDEDQGRAEDKAALDDAAKKTPFSLKGGSSSFSSRSHSIFDCLDNMAKMTSSSMGQDNVIDGVFARPVAPPPPSRKTSHPPSSSSPPAKKRGVPDYMVNPDRWTHYSLEDTAETSEQGNSRVAHQYLASLLQKKDEPVMNRDFNSEEKIIFSKPSRVGKEQPSNKMEKEGKEKAMRLSHLEDEEDEDEDKKGMLKKRNKEDFVDIEKKQMGVGDRDDDDDDDGDDDGTQEANSGFVAFKKTHHKMYRKSSAERSQT